MTVRPSLAVLAVLAWLGPVAGGDAAALYYVVDGDTLYMGAEKIRILGIDAPETHPSHCANEARLGKQATDRLGALLAAGPLKIERHGFDQYGRTLAKITVGGVDVGAELVAERLAHVYVNHKLPWC